MTAADYVAQAYLKGTGKVSSLVSTDPDYIKILALGNYYTQTWAKEPGVDWRSLYDDSVSCGTVTATDTFTLDSTIYKVSQNEDDPVRIVDASDPTQYYDYTVVPADRLKHYAEGNYCAQIANTLKFNRAFVSTDPAFGGTINVPAFTLPATLTTGNVLVDIPEWLSTRVGAEYARTNLVLANQYPNLLAEANELMKKMVENNNSQLETVPLRKAAFGRTW